MSFNQPVVLLHSPQSPVFSVDKELLGRSLIGRGSMTSLVAVPSGLSVNEWIATQSGCGVVWCGGVWCGLVWWGLVWSGVVWLGVLWWGVMWCSVVWCGGCGGV